MPSENDTAAIQMGTEPSWAKAELVCITWMQCNKWWIKAEMELIAEDSIWWFLKYQYWKRYKLLTFPSYCNWSKQHNLSKALATVFKLCTEIPIMKAMRSKYSLIFSLFLLFHHQMKFPSGKQFCLPIHILPGCSWAQQQCPNSDEVEGHLHYMFNGHWFPNRLRPETYFPVAVALPSAMATRSKPVPPYVLSIIHMVNCGGRNHGKVDVHHQCLVKCPTWHKQG